MDDSLETYQNNNIMYENREMHGKELRDQEAGRRAKGLVVAFCMN